MAGKNTSYLRNVTNLGGIFDVIGSMHLLPL